MIKETQRWDNNLYYRSPRAVDTYDTDGLEPAESLVLTRYVAGSAPRVLDLACGTGRTTRFLSHLGVFAVGADRSAAMIERAHSYSPQLVMCVMDALELGFREETFDCVLCAGNALDFLVPYDARMRALQQVRRVLKPSGFFIFSSHNLHFLAPRNRETAVNLLRNLLRLNVRRGYRLEVTTAGRMWNFYQSIEDQGQELASAGFELVEIVSSYRLANRYRWALDVIDPYPYYVARKSRTSRP